MNKHGKLKIIPLGGLGEVGKNMTVYEFDRKILIVDAGIMFPENDMLGIDYIIPDYDYLRGKGDQILGIVITHGHEDHIGAIQHVLNDFPVPVYATPLTRGLIEVKLARNNASNKGSLHTVQAGKSIELGPFKVEFFHISHSIPDAVGTRYHHTRRPGRPHERFQIRSHTGGRLAHRLCQIVRVCCARRGLVAF